MKVEWLLEMNITKRISLYYLIGNEIIFEMIFLINLFWWQLKGNKTVSRVYRPNLLLSLCEL